MGFIYILENKINGKCYVGQTIQKKCARLNAHKYRTKRNYNYPIYKAIEKYGWDNFNIYKIPCENESLDYFERGFIKKMNSQIPNGYNIESGGFNNRNVSRYTRNKMSLARLGKSPWNKGKQWSDEMKKKMSESSKGINCGSNNHKSRKIKCIEINKIYDSIHIAGKELNIFYQNIWKCCTGKRHTAGGYHWEYA